MKRNRWLGIMLASAVCASPWTIANAEGKAAESSTPVKLSVTHSDQEAASHYSHLFVRARARAGSSKVSLGTALVKTERLGLAAGAGSLVKPETNPATQPAVPAPGFYPADLSYQGGAVLPTALIHDIYVDSNSSDFGLPGTDIVNWNNSQLLHVLDQYVGETVKDRYQSGAWGTFDYPIFTTLGDNDLLNIVHASAAAIGSGYGHVYNIFLPQGVDYCDTSVGCYSPDNEATFTFCAFHSSVDFPDIGHVIFTLEPYQNVEGCSILQPSPNGALVDSTMSVLSHELSETITDPDGTGWLAFNSLAVYGDEIGDLCQSVDPTGPYFENPISNLNGTNYEVQLEYSNKYHACANVP